MNNNNDLHNALKSLFVYPPPIPLYICTSPSYSPPTPPFPPSSPLYLPTSPSYSPPSPGKMDEITDGKDAIYNPGETDDEDSDVIITSVVTRNKRKRKTQKTKNPAKKSRK